MGRIVVLVLVILVAVPTLSTIVEATSVTKVRAVVAVHQGFDLRKVKAVLGQFGTVEKEIPEIGVVVLSVPKNTVERLRGLAFARYVEEDVVLEVGSKSSSKSSGVSRPRVSITDYTKEVTVTVEGLGEVSFTIKNVGKVDVSVIVELRNERGIAVARTDTVALPPSSSYSGRLEFTAPSAAGTYSWTLAVVDSSSQSTVYASATVTVRVVTPSSETPSSPSDSTYSDTIGWNVQMINATKVWAMSVQYGDSAYGYSVVVQLAIVDTGVDYTHQDLTGAVVWCVASLSGTLYRGSDLSQCADPNGHGTHVAGIAAARLNNWGIAGVAPKVVLYAVRVFDSSGKGYASDIALGIIEAVKGPDGVVGTEDDADVVSMSFGGPSSSVVYDAIRYAYTAGAVLVAASGNSGGSTPLCPACYPEVIAVGAVDRYYTVPSWSNRNPDVVAPGSGVLSTWIGNKHVVASGTSMACPHVSAAVALAQAVRLASGRQKLAPAQMIDLVRSTAVDLGLPGYDQETGYGLVDAYSLVLRSLNL
ncbi:MAG: S8 family serine peptidase [Sulfolobales archaeon]